MERLTKKGGLDFTDKNLSLREEWGYSYIYNRLAELEDKIEGGELKECGGESCPNFKHYQAECECCTQTMEVKKSLEIESAVQQAVKEFAEKLKEVLNSKHWAVFANAANKDIDNLITELYGADEW